MKINNCRPINLRGFCAHLYWLLSPKKSVFLDLQTKMLTAKMVFVSKRCEPEWWNLGLSEDFGKAI